MTPQFLVVWVDAGREPRSPPNPDYPEGIEVDVSDGRTPACTIPLPYPAKRIGHYNIDCAMCGGRFALTTAGRPDDPRSLTVHCPKDERNLPHA